MATTTSTYCIRYGGKMFAGGEGAHQEEHFFVHFAAADDYCELPTELRQVQAASHMLLTVPDADVFVYLAETNGTRGIPVAAKGSVQCKRSVTTSALDVGVVLKGV